MLRALVGLLAQFTWAGPQNGIIPLNGHWRFRAGDDSAYARADYDDRRWDSIPVPGRWTVAGQPYQGHAWYRLRIQVGAGQQQPLAITFRSVATAYEVFADGRWLGGLGGFPPRYRPRSVVPATYVLPSSFLTPGEHLIAVRVYSAESFGGITGSVTFGEAAATQRASQLRDFFYLATAFLLVGIGASQIIFWVRRMHATEHLYIFAFAVLFAAFFITGLHSVRLWIEPRVYWFRLYLAFASASSAAFLFGFRRIFSLDGDRLYASLAFLFAVSTVPAFLLPDLGQLRRLENWALNPLYVVSVVATVWGAARQMRLGVRHARILLWGTGFLGVAIVHDILVTWGLLAVEPTSQWMIMLGGIAFTGALAMTTADKFVQSEEAALYDRLTGLYRREVVMDALQREIRRASRTRQPLAAIMLDIDHFKQVNDTQGHQVGDRVLAEIGRRLAVAGRAVDWLGRYGGEEFLAVLAATSSQGAVQAAERLRSAVAALPIATGRLTRTITLSAGVAAYEGEEDWPTPEELIGRADTALYRAKNAGRDCVRE